MIRAIRVVGINGELDHAQFKTLTSSVLAYLEHIGAINFIPNVELSKAVASIELVVTFDGLLLIDDVEVINPSQFLSV